MLLTCFPGPSHAKIMSYEDIVEALKKRDAKELLGSLKKKKKTSTRARRAKRSCVDDIRADGEKES